MAALTDDQIAKFKAEKNAQALVELPSGEQFLFHPPTRQVYNKWFDQMEKVSATANALELVTACLVYPDYNSVIAALDKYPALLTGKNGFQDAITGMAGFVSGGMASIKKI